MTRKIVGFFASSVLSVALSVPAMARETNGTIEAIDADRSEVRLSDGEAYQLPDGFDAHAIAVGMDVVVLFDEVARVHLVDRPEAI